MIEISRVHDAFELDAFLTLHAHSSAYLRSELRRATGAFFVARDQGRIVAAATQAPSGMVLLQAPQCAGAVATAVLNDSARRLAGFFGPLVQVRSALRDMGLGQVGLLKDTAEDLFALALADLRVPAILAQEQVRCRVAVESDFEHLVAWRYAFRQATLNDAPGEKTMLTSGADIAALLPAGSLFILEGEQALACCSFNARLPRMVQIGNVWTPPALRGHGYARAVVAGALAIARDAGVVEAVLATGRSNAAAQAAYRAIGFNVVGDYATVTLAPWTTRGVL
ncbi:GNAT family N-acetyltransferase [Massilia sp. TSP1-1-2]|uniref:GNAT family N-acetyltransferase n=1 Tax=Massilia sp. TSP1-1-2 TaxID=2804649 RepID=UPI003CE69CBF